MALINKKLTIVITTYNRKGPLIKQLKSIEIQGQFDKYNLIISNNKSEYDVEEWINDNLTNDFLKIISVNNRPYNVGGDVNISFTFQLVKTQWMWLLSDDDITMSNSLETILSDIEKYDDVCWLKYSISGYNHFNDVRIQSLSSLFNTFSNKIHFVGEMVFMSNNVYNINLLHDYIGYAPIYADTCISQLIPPLFAIKKERKVMILRSASLTNFEGGRPSYSILYVSIRFGNLVYTDLELNKEEIKAFKRLKFNSLKEHYLCLLDVKDITRRNEMFKKIFVSYYKFYSVRGLAFFLLYLTSNLLRINIKLIERTKRLVK